MFLGGVFVLVWITGYIAIAATIGSWLINANFWVMLLYYPIAGFAWVLPLKPLLAWMSRPDPDAQDA
jgi:membrane protein implicated in regulation of membrane protease activity